MSTTPPSRPIPIASNSHHRGRSASVSSIDSIPGLSSSVSANSSYPVQTPLSKPLTPSSPILSYFFGAKDIGGKPLSPSAIKGMPKLPPVVDDEPETLPGSPGAAPVLGHHRALSTSAATWSRFPAGSGTATTGLGPVSPPSAQQQEASQRGANVLRRLSLSGFNRPILPPIATNSTMLDEQRASTLGSDNKYQGRAGGRRATLSAMDGAQYKPRAPSPMGERMLKGHFDGF